MLAWLARFAFRRRRLVLVASAHVTLVRVLIVPSTMRLFGDLNWWAPAALAHGRRPARVLGEG